MLDIWKLARVEGCKWPLAIAAVLMEHLGAPKGREFTVVVRKNARRRERRCMVSV